MHFRECGGGRGGERGREGGREAGKQAGSLGHLIQLLAILLWDHYTALLLSQSACLLPAAYAYPSVHTGRVFGQYGWKYKIQATIRMRKLQSSSKRLLRGSESTDSRSPGQALIGELDIYMVIGSSEHIKGY